MVNRLSIISWTGTETSWTEMSRTETSWTETSLDVDYSGHSGLKRPRTETGQTETSGTEKSRTEPSRV